MCWNAEVSLKSFVVGAAAIVFGAVHGMSAPVLLFCASIVLMQLVEYFTWTHLEDLVANRRAAYAASALLSLQPIASLLTIHTPSIRNALLTAYILFGILDHFTQPKEEAEKRDYSMSKAPNGHLQWNWLSPLTPRRMLSLAVYFVFLLVPLIINKHFELLVLALGTLGISAYTYLSQNTWGSMWCWIVNLIVLWVVGKNVF